MQEGQRLADAALPRSPLPRITGFDYLRAIFSVLVVLWHAQGLALLAQVHPGFAIASEVIYYNLCLLAVPIFLHISLFLFYQKIEQDPTYFVQRRLPQILSIYGIWLLIGIVVNALSGRGQYLASLMQSQSLIRLMIQGSRAELFFIASLIFLTTLAFLYNQFFHAGRGTRMEYSLLLLALCPPLGCILASWITENSGFTTYWNPLNFIPCVFSASILASYHQRWVAQGPVDSGRWQWSMPVAIGLIMGFLLLSWGEWQVWHAPQKFGYLLPIYARPSLVVGSMLMIAISFSITQKPPAIIRLLAQESLGIYLLHNYFVNFFGKRFDTLLNHHMGPTFCLKVILPIVLSIGISRLIKRSPWGKRLLG